MQVTSPAQTSEEGKWTWDLDGKDNGAWIQKEKVVSIFVNNLPQLALWPKLFITFPYEKDTHFYPTPSKVSFGHAIIFKVWILHLVQIICISTLNKWSLENGKNHNILHLKGKMGVCGILQSIAILNSHSANVAKSWNTGAENVSWLQSSSAPWDWTLAHCLPPALSMAHKSDVLNEVGYALWVLAFTLWDVLYFIREIVCACSWVTFSACFLPMQFIKWVPLNSTSEVSVITSS